MVPHLNDAVQKSPSAFSSGLKDKLKAVDTPKRSKRNEMKLPDIARHIPAVELDLTDSNVAGLVQQALLASSPKLASAISVQNLSPRRHGSDASGHGRRKLVGLPLTSSSHGSEKAQRRSSGRLSLYNHTGRKQRSRSTSALEKERKNKVLESLDIAKENANVRRAQSQRHLISREHGRNGEMERSSHRRARRHRAEDDTRRSKGARPSSRQLIRAQSDNQVAPESPASFTELDSPNTMSQSKSPISRSNRSSSASSRRLGSRQGSFSRSSRDESNGRRKTRSCHGTIVGDGGLNDLPSQPNGRSKSRSSHGKSRNCHGAVTSPLSSSHHSRDRTEKSKKNRKNLNALEGWLSNGDDEIKHSAHIRMDSSEHSSSNSGMSSSQHSKMEEQDDNGFSVVSHSQGWQQHGQSKLTSPLQRKGNFSHSIRSHMTPTSTGRGKVQIAVVKTAPNSVPQNNRKKFLRAASESTIQSNKVGDDSMPRAFPDMPRIDSAPQGLTKLVRSPGAYCASKRMLANRRKDSKNRRSNVRDALESLCNTGDDGFQL